MYRGLSTFSEGRHFRLECDYKNLALRSFLIISMHFARMYLRSRVGLRSQPGRSHDILSNIRSVGPMVLPGPREQEPPRPASPALAFGSRRPPSSGSDCSAEFGRGMSYQRYGRRDRMPPASEDGHCRGRGPVRGRQRSATHRQALAGLF